MHQGVGLPGHLRLTLESVIPRFIVRYNVLRDQITRLSLGSEAAEQAQLAVSSDNADVGAQLANLEGRGQEEETTTADNEEAQPTEAFDRQEATNDDDEAGFDEDGEGEHYEGDTQAENDGDKEAHDPVEAVAINDSEGQQPFEESDEDAEGVADDAHEEAETGQVEQPLADEGTDDFGDEDGDDETDPRDPTNPAVSDEQKLAADEISVTGAEGANVEGGAMNATEIHAVPDEDDFGSDEEEEEPAAEANSAQENVPPTADHASVLSVHAHERARPISNSTSTSSLNTEDLAWTVQAEGDAEAVHEAEQTSTFYASISNGMLTMFY